MAFCTFESVCWTIWFFAMWSPLLIGSEDKFSPLQFQSGDRNDGGETDAFIRSRITGFVFWEPSGMQIFDDVVNSLPLRSRSGCTIRLSGLRARLFLQTEKSELSRPEGWAVYVMLIRLCRA